MKSKTPIILLTLFSLIVPQQAIAASQAKAGAKCTKVKSTQVVGTKKFTCVKSGSRLVWNKGVEVANKESHAPSSATASQDKVPSAGDPAIRKTNCGIGDWYYKSVDGKQNRSF